jgi:Mrp family chromosome partitioning ATPase
MDAELAKAVDDATSASRVTPAKSASDSGLPKVIIAPEATIPAQPKSTALPSFPMEPESAKVAAAPATANADASAPATTVSTPAARRAEAAAARAEPAPRSAEAAALPVERASSAERGLPVLAVAGQRGTSGPSAEPPPARVVERSPYAAVAEAARISSIPPPVAPVPDTASDERHPGDHVALSTEPVVAQASPRSLHIPPKPARADDDSIKPQPIAAVDGARIEASPIMGIEEGMSTAASGKQGISVYPPPVAPVPSSPQSQSPHATMRLGSVSPGDASGGSHSGRRVTQTLGTPLGMNPSTAPAFGWTPHAAFGAHQVPPRESDPPPGLVSIPPAPKPPSHIGAVPLPIGSSRPVSSPATQSLPVTPARHIPAVHVPPTDAEAPSTALALTRPHTSRTRSEPPLASSVVCDVPKGWAPHPTLINSETSEELAALRDQLYRLASRECFVVGVSSGPEMAAYKSGVAGRLAWMLAEPGHARILLMEGDFDHPVVHRLMRIDMPIATGFSEQMRRRMNGSPPGPWTIVRCAPNLYVLAEGLVRSPGLLPTVHFADSVNELRRAYDLIVIDGPAGGMSVDTRALDAVADGIVLAGESDLLDRAASWFGKKQLMAVVSAGPPVPNSR